MEQLKVMILKKMKHFMLSLTIFAIIKLNNAKLTIVTFHILMNILYILLIYFYQEKG